MSNALVLKIVAMIRAQEAQPTDLRAVALQALEANNPAEWLFAVHMEAGVAPPAPEADDGVESDANTGERAAQPWTDWLGGHRTQGNVRLFIPRDLPAVKAALAVDGSPVRVRSSRHADNPNGQPVADGRMIDLRRLSGLVAPPVGTTVRLFGGTTIHDANRLLADAGLGLPSMGSYDGQTLPGALCTGTHGSYTKLGPLADTARSVTALRPNGDTIVSSRGDANFNALALGVGLCGIVTELTLETRRAFILKEERWTTTWERLKDEVVQGVTDGQWSDRVELLVSPYTTKTERYAPRAETSGHSVLVTERYEVGPWKGEADQWASPLKHDALAIGRVMPTWLVRAISLADRDKVPNKVDASMRLLSTTGPGKPMGHNVGRADHILMLNLGKKGHGFEVAVPLDALPGFVDRVLAVCQSEHESPEGSVLVSPFSVRFVKATELWLAPQNRFDNQGRTVKIWAMIEIPRLCRADPSEDNKHIRVPRKVLTSVLDAGGRPHWGQYDGLDGFLWKGLPVTAERLYPKTIDAWRTVRRNMDPAGLMLNQRNRTMMLA